MLNPGDAPSRFREGEIPKFHFPNAKSWIRTPELSVVGASLGTSVRTSSLEPGVPRDAPTWPDLIYTFFTAGNRVEIADDAQVRPLRASSAFASESDHFFGVCLLAFGFSVSRGAARDGPISLPACSRLCFNGRNPTPNYAMVLC